jgi:hypothetical protein
VRRAEYGSSEEDDIDNDLFAEETDVATTSCANPIPSSSGWTAGTSKGKAKDKRPPSAPSESALIDQLASSSAQYDRMQAAVSALISSQTNSVPKAYGAFLASFAADVHPRLVSNFMRESWDLVMRYKDQGDSLLEAERSTRPPDSATKQQQQPGFYPAQQGGYYPPQQGQQQNPQAPEFSRFTAPPMHQYWRPVATSVETSVGNVSGNASTRRAMCPASQVSLLSCGGMRTLYSEHW